MKFAFATVLLFVATAFCTDGPHAMVNLYEADPDTAFGETSHGVVKKDSNGKDVTTLISFPVHGLGRNCELSFSKWDIATGSKTIALFDFVPNGGARTFDVGKATFNSKTGHRDILRAVFVAGSPNPVYKFDCTPGTLINFEAVPSNGEDDVEWWWRKGTAGGFLLSMVNE